MTKLLWLAVASCDAQCDDRYHKAEDYKHVPDTPHPTGPAPLVRLPPPVHGVP